MFLTKKALRKIKRLVGFYIGIGIFCIVIAVLFACLKIDSGIDKSMVLIGAFALLFGVLFRKIGRYAEGKAKLINHANKLVHNELRPAEFIRLYEQARDCPDNVVSEPDFDVLRLLVLAYDALGETEQVLDTLEQILAIAPAGMRPMAIILKASVLYEMGSTEEAEALYAEVVNMELNFVTRPVMEALVKLDRAMALGDFVTAEAYCRQSLQRKSFPKNTPLSILYTNFNLAKICLKTNRPEEAREYLQYCIENGGETAIKSKAADRLREIE
ncbi:MAG: hypothetical protein IKY44_03505 [Clostridia bacterium]|nr:hypothetical protein [Clostridia bacterium]